MSVFFNAKASVAQLQDMVIDNQRLSCLETALWFFVSQDFACQASRGKRRTCLTGTMGSAGKVSMTCAPSVSGWLVTEVGKGYLLPGGRG